ncbi:RsmE family RNA methyltransferase [Candidatus Dependentiae bacterium]
MKNHNSHVFSICFDDGNFEFLDGYAPGDVVSLRDINVFRRVSKILRLKVGDRFILFNDKSNIEGCLVSFERKDTISFEILGIDKNQVVVPRIKIFVGFTKKLALENIAYYAAQLGVESLHLISSDRVQRKWGGKKELERLRAVMRSAREQAKSFCEPEVFEPCKLGDVEFGKNDLEIVFESSSDEHIKNLWRAHKNVESSSIFFGPEGGFSCDELSFLEKKGVKSYSLLSAVLRTQEAVLLGAGSIISMFS